MNRVYRNASGLTLAVALGIAGCASDGPAPVEDRTGGSYTRPAAPMPSTPPRAAASGTYRVQRGDTLYSIAFRNGVDFRDLADWNNIPPPYTIYPGRELRLSGRSSGASRTVARAPASTTPAPRPASPPPGVATPKPFEPVASSPSTPASEPASPPATSASTVPPIASSPNPTAPPPKPVPTAPDTAAVNGNISWRWPADGQVVGTYIAGDPVRQGIDIAGASGAPVHAAADGQVVYSGNGLIGYGELIIVKHNAAFLSAYGHNRKRLVKEGDRVKSGQTIAEMGSSSANRDELHFEIRKNGKPSNPMDYLPRR